MKEGVLLKEMLLFIGMGEYRMELLLDAASTRALLHKKGPGRMKHLDVRALWMQDLVAAGGLSTRKIDRLLNLSDPLTHSPTAMELEVFREGIGMMNLTFEEHQQKADKAGQYYRAAVTAKATAKAVAAVILAATLKVVKAETEPQECASERAQNLEEPGAEERTTIWLWVILVVVLLLAVRGVVAVVRDMQTCCQRQPPAAATSAAEPGELAVPVAGRRAQDLRDHGADADQDLQNDGHEVPRDYLRRSCAGTRASDWDAHAVR